MRLSDDEPTAGTAAPRQHAGWFRFYFADDRWEWSPEVQVLHGYPPGSITPTTAMVLSHKHPEDREHIAHLLTEIRDNHQAFSSRHRIVATDGSVRHVIVVADTLADATGDVVGTQGFYVDVTPVEEDGDRERLTAAIAEIAENRAVIEQAKGMLMVVYGVTADAAFDLLRWRSQDANVKLRRLAEQVVADFFGLAQREQSPARAAYDNLLLTADRRIAGLA
jgi:PAS domain S-box-containing protein